MAINLLGKSGALIDSDATWSAQFISHRPAPILNWNSFSAKSGAMTGFTALSTCFAFRNTGTNLALLRRLSVSFITTTAFTAPQVIDFQLGVARAFTASWSGGTAIALTGNNMKHRTSHATFSSSDMRIVTSSALSSGARVFDTNAIGMVQGYSSGAGVTIPKASLFFHDAEDYPLVMANNEGFEIQLVTSMGATGVGILYVEGEIFEIAAANWPG